MVFGTLRLRSEREALGPICLNLAQGTFNAAPGLEEVDLILGDESTSTGSVNWQYTLDGSRQVATGEVKIVSPDIDALWRACLQRHGLPIHM